RVLHPFRGARAAHPGPLIPGHSSWTWRPPPAQRQVLGAPDVIHELGARHEAYCAVDRDGQLWRLPRREVESVGGAPTGEGVEAQGRVLRAQAQRAIESLRSRLVGRDLLGAGNVTGRGQGDGYRLIAGLVGVQPEPGVP